MDDLLARARLSGTPLVDDGAATFVWEGDEAPQLIGDFNGWGRRPPKTALEEAEPHVWAATLSFPSDAYLEYSYRLGEGRVDDPLNPRLTPNGVGGYHNWFAMPGFRETPLTEERPEVERGTVVALEVECGVVAVGETRIVHLYRPPVEAACPLLFVLDGQDYLERGRLVTIVDILIAERRIRPINMALVDHGGQARFLEYNCSDATLGFLDRIQKSAREHLDLLEDATLTGVLGASMGGLMALYAALRAPAYVGRALSQSGSFGPPAPDFESVIYEVARHAQARPAIWMDVGRYEALLESNRNMHGVLVERGHNVTLREFHGGHNYVSWRNDVWRGLEALYGAH